MRETRSLYIDMAQGDTAGPRRGDYLQPMGKKGPGTLYRVLISRLVKRKNPQAPPRYSMTVKIVDERGQRGQLWTFTWYPRKKKTFETYMRRGLPIG